ncbi:rhamnan synthesis F protein [Fadolivirus algeromassiliense]|jgi:hypothetical protein|uniref:Rhamnan synthesis F protein n=1 Tax=Fadolivirus FV1/VV64 TaxID=3070911 RepID=A0A7D3QV11_9VIRU|nr:rhamnan synthesis F protein [Fadolivirus algeromassiliense]QKF93546.1 rhamnan synthesis F protein [Fadolivirus FV1/VV64]
MKKVAVIYCTHVLNLESKFFLDHGYYISDNVDFYICLNGQFDSEIYNKRANELNLHNLYFYTRQNEGHDFGGWSYILNLTKDDKKIYEYYDYFILLNSTCLGPFIPMYCLTNWIDIFINMITDKVKLVGPTINHYYGKPHIQSYMLCMDRIGMKIGIEKGIFDGAVYKEKMDYVFKKEIQFSLEILNAGYKIKSLLKAYEHIDFTELVGIRDKQFPFGNLINKTNCDVCMPYSYYNMSLHPYEVVFLKSNRHIADNAMVNYAQFQYYMKKDNISKMIFK